MRALLGEYTNTILAAVVGAFVLILGTFVLSENLNVLFPVTDTAGIEQTNNQVGKAPVLVVPDNLKIQKGDKNYDAKSISNKTSAAYKKVKQNYLKLVKAYENSSCKEVCSNVDVSGIEDININKIGNNILIYQARNREGETYLKRANIIVN